MPLLPVTACSKNSRCPCRNSFPSTFFVSLLSKRGVERLSDKDTEKTLSIFYKPFSLELSSGCDFGVFSAIKKGNFVTLCTFNPVNCRRRQSHWRPSWKEGEIFA